MALDRHEARRRDRLIAEEGGSPAWECRCRALNDEVGIVNHIGQMRKNRPSELHEVIAVRDHPLKARHGPRMRSNADPEAMLGIPLPLTVDQARKICEGIEWPDTRFLETGRASPCWPWRGHRNANGYGRVTLYRRGTGRGSVPVRFYVHRVTYTIFRGPIPPAAELDHRCLGGPREDCANPWHVEPLTHEENITARTERDRASRTEVPY